MHYPSSCRTAFLFLDRTETLGHADLIQQANDALEARELIKGKVLENSLLTAREACQMLAEMTKAEPVQFIGNKFVLYKENKEIDKEKRIKLVK